MSGITWVAYPPAVFDSKAEKGFCILAKIDGSEIVDVDLHEARVKLLEDIEGHAWIATDKGAYQYEGGVFMPILEPGLPVRSISSALNRIWLSTRDGVHLFKGRDGHSQFFPLDGLLARHIIPDDRGGVWVVTERRKRRS